MEKEILYCKKFKFKDQYLQDLLGNHPRAGFLYKIEIDDSGARRIVLEKNGRDYLLYISGEKSEDLRYSFEFVKFKPSLIFDDMRIPQASNPKLMEEWLASSNNEKETVLNPFEDALTPMSDLKALIEESDSFISDEEYIQGFMEDLRSFYPGIYEGFMNSITYLNDIMTNQKNLEGEVSEEVLARLLDAYSKNKRLESLALLQLAILNKFNKEG